MSIIVLFTKAPNEKKTNFPKRRIVTLSEPRTLCNNSKFILKKYIIKGQCLFVVLCLMKNTTYKVI